MIVQTLYLGLDVAAFTVFIVVLAAVSTWARQAPDPARAPTARKTEARSKMRGPPAAGAAQPQ
jgi:hypothetical protein